MKDYYEILGLQHNASEKEIRERYRYLAFVYHPDRFSDPQYKSQAEEDLKLINEAFAVLSNLKKRSEYDWLKGQGKTSYPTNVTKQDKPYTQPTPSKEKTYTSPTSRKEEKKDIWSYVIYQLELAKQEYRDRITKKIRGQGGPATVNLRNLDLSQLDLSDIYKHEIGGKDEWIKFDFSNSNLRNTNLSGNTLHEPIFRGAILEGTKFIRANFFNAEFDGSTILKNVDFSHSKLRIRDKLNGYKFSVCRFYQADLFNIEMIGCQFEDNIFDGCVLSRSTLNYTDFSNASMIEVNLHASSAICVIFTNAILTKSVLGASDFTNANFFNAILDSSNLVGCNLNGADLRNAKLVNSNLTICDLIGADLSNCDLRGADFHATNFCDANLRDAKLTGVKWPEWAKVNDRTIFPDGSTKRSSRDLSKFT
jgi:uncharacterized protein YjbI with pentapeptide repeats